MENGLPLGIQGGFLSRTYRVSGGADSAEGLVVEGEIPLFKPHEVSDPSLYISGMGNDMISEVFAEGSIDVSLFKDSQSPCVYCYNHREDNPLSSTRNNTLEVKKTSEGISFVSKLNPDVAQSKDVYALLKRGDVGGHSFRFRPEKVSYDDEKNLVVYEKVSIFTDISCVSRPMYQDTTHKLRELKRCLNGEFSGYKELEKCETKKLRNRISDLLYRINLRKLGI